MKARQGFVSNSSSSSFIVILDDKTRHLAHYNWKVKLVEYISKDNLDEEVWDQATSNWNTYRKVFTRDNYQRDPELEKEYRKTWNNLREVWTKEDYIRRIPCDTQLDRSTGICLGGDLILHSEELKEAEHHIGTANKIDELIAEYSIDNVMLLRQSDESMGGDLPKELEGLCKTAIYEEEYH